MRIKHKYFDEAVPYIDAAVKQTKRLKQISDAAFQRQDIDEIESLALALRKEIEAALQPFYMGHMCLYVTPDVYKRQGQVADNAGVVEVELGCGYGAFEDIIGIGLQ